MDPGSLVQFKYPPKVAGALTALKYAARMEARIGKRTGLVLEVNSNNAVVSFEGEIIIIHVMFLDSICKINKI